MKYRRKGKKEKTFRSDIKDHSLTYPFASDTTGQNTSYKFARTISKERFLELTLVHI